MSFEPIAFTRQLIDIESISGNEAEVGGFLEKQLRGLDYTVERFACAPGRFDVYALPKGVSSPDLVFSTHMDTVPPFIASSEDAENIYGRGACDAKGIIAAQVAAVERLRSRNVRAGLLFLVGEDRDSLGS